jgi:hypothetical protein
LDRWEWRSPYPQGNDLLSAAHGNGTWVVGGVKGALLASTNQFASWQVQRLGRFGIESLAYGNGAFVAVGNENAPTTNSFCVSTNGLDWIDLRSQLYQNFMPNRVAFGNGRFLALLSAATTDRRVGISTNGFDWQWLSTGGTAPEGFHSLVFGQGQFVSEHFYSTGGPNGIFSYVSASSNGVDWIRSELPTFPFLPLLAGEFSEMLSLALTVAFEKGGAFASSLFGNPQTWSGMGQAMIGALAPFGKALLTFASIFNDMMIAGIMRGEARIVEFISGGKIKAPAFKELFGLQRQNSKAGMDEILGTDAEFARNVAGFLTDGVKDIGAATQEAFAAMRAAGGESEEQLNAMIARFAAKREAIEKKRRDDPKDDPKSSAPDFTSAGFFSLGGQIRGPSVNSLQSLGGLFGATARNAGADYTKQTANGVSQTNKHLLNLIGAVKGLRNATPQNID